MDTSGIPQTAAQWVRKHSTHRRNVRLVLSTLASEIDAGNNCPSHNELAELTGLSKPTIQKALGELEKDGTIASIKNGGDVKNGGKKNCYTLPGMHPGKIDTRSNNTPVKLIPGQTEPGKDAEDAPVRTHDAAGEQLLLSQDSLVQSNPDKTRPVVNSEQDAPPVNTPATTYAESLAAAPPKVQAIANALIANAQPVDSDVSSAPPPNSAETPAPESPEAHDYWRSQLPGFGLSTGYKTRLNKAVKKYGFLAVQDAIDAARLEGSRLDYPMAWVEGRLEKQEAEGKLPGQVEPASPGYVEPERNFMTGFKGFQKFDTEQEAAPC